MKKRNLLCLLLAVLLLLAGCQTETTAPTEPTTEEAQTVPVTEPVQEVKKLGLAYVQEYGLNPYSCVGLVNRPIFSLLYESLFVLSGDFEPEPVLCDTFTVSDDGRTYRFRLCADAKFSDGTPVTAADAAASLQAADGSKYYGSRFDRVRSFAALEDGTLEISLSGAYENLPLLLDVPIVKASTAAAALPTGSGPYSIHVTSAGGRLTRNNNWWQDAALAVDVQAIPLTRVKTPIEIRDSFEFGSVALVCADLNSSSSVGYRCDYELWNCSTTVMQYLGFNLGSPLFAAQAVRANVTRALDRSEIVSKIYSGFAEAAVLPCNPKSSLYDQKLAEQYGYAPQRLTSAVRAAGIPADTAGTILVCSADSSRVELAYYIADILAANGLQLSVRAVDAEDFDSYRSRGLYDMFIGEVRLSGNFDLTAFFSASGSLAYGGIRDESLAQLCESALENSGSYYDLHKAVMDKGLFCPILFKSYAVMATRGLIGNLRPAVDNIFHLPGVRTLADASIAELPESTEPTTEADTQETSEPPTEG